MNVLIRTDASSQIGTGHLMRCLTLAGYLRGQGASVGFVCRRQPGGLGNLVSEKGFALHELPKPTGIVPGGEDDYAAWLGVSQEQDAEETSEVVRNLDTRVNWLITDHYGLGFAWESMLRDGVGRIMVIDDLANRRHDCDLLLDQNFYLDMTDRYRGLIPDACRTLLGPQFAILRPEFLEARQNLGERDGKIRRILVFYGGCDVTGETVKAMQALPMTGLEDVTVDVVVGAGNLRRDEIRSYCERLQGATFLTGVTNMADRMAKADLALGAGGTTTWERSFMGLPSITTTIADNQRVMLEAMASAGALWHLGDQAELCAADIAEAVREASQEPERLRSIGRAALGLMGTPQAKGSHPVVVALMDEN